MTKGHAISLPIVASLGLLISGLLSSCAVVAVGAVVGTVAYIEGELVSYVSADMFQTVDATLEAVEDLQLTPVRQSGDRYKATMVTLNPEGEKVTIKLTPESSDITKVRIRYGNIGDKDASAKVLNAIERNL